MKYFFFACILFCTSLTAQQTDVDRALLAYTSGRYEEALVAIQSCITRDTANYRYTFLKGRILENLYRYDEAIAEQRKALRMNSGSIEAQAALASLYFLSGQPDVSAQFYEQLVTAEPQINRWKMNWATALYAAGKPERALEQLISVEQTDTTNWLVYKNMGDCYYRLDSLIQTYENYFRALQLYPYNKNLYGTLMRLFVTNEDYLGALAVGEKAIAIDSTNVEAWKYLGVAYRRTGNNLEAYRAFVRTLALGDSSLTTCSHFGALSYQMQNNYEAEKYLFKAYLLDPKDMFTMALLATTYGHTGKAQKGLDILDKIDSLIAKTDTIGMQANIRRGTLFYRLFRYEDAAKCFITATKQFPKNPRYFYEVALCYDKARNKKLALEWYLAYLKKVDPKWATREWTEKELEKLGFVNIAMERVQSLQTDLSSEKGKK